MDHMYWVIFASLLGCTIALKSTTGREFVTGFVFLESECILKLDIASTTNGDVEVNVPYLGINTTFSFNRTFSTTFSRSLQLYGTTIGHNGVYIKSTVDVSVYITTYCYSGTSEDTHVCLPIQSLGRTYYISSYTPNSGFPSVFMVISEFANTEVNISFPNGTSISKTLTWLGVYQEASPKSDLTGTIIQSSKPVSVVSGVPCTSIPQGVYCDLLSEQMIPTKAFQTYFIIPPILSNQFMVRILSSQSNNKVCVKDSLFENCTTMGSNKWLESVPQHSALVITSQEPISVIQYKENSAYMTAYMTIIPGIRQFMNLYTFVVPEIYTDNNNYISVTILLSASQTLRLDGKPPSDQLVVTSNVEPPFNNYTVLTFRITAGYHVMASTEIHVVFGLIVFGIGINAAYGYPAGINFEIDECAPNPCLFDGTCSNGVNGYACTCRAGVSGRNCDTDINECASSPCLHGGTCSDGINAYTCTCSAGFSGRNCEITDNECASSPCLHGGTCSDGVNAYTCTCSAGFSGKNCEININDCASSPCLHGGTCSDGVNAYTCTCSAGFRGMNCEINFNECASSPCLHGGTCSDGINAYTCTCSAGFIGRNCEININECASSPCLHGGTCSDGVNAYTCTCSAGYSGRNCEIKGVRVTVQNVALMTTVMAVDAGMKCSAIGNGLLRSSPRCKSCCDQDFCNTNCTHHQSIGIID